MPTRMPEERARRTRVALIAVAAVVACIAAAAAVWAITRPNTPPSTRPSTFTPADETTASTRTATTSAGQVATAPSGASMPTVTVVTPSVPASKMVATFAFHLGLTLYVANEDASRIVPVKVPEDVYRLSPDGAAVAVVRSGRMVIVAVGSGAVRDAGPAVEVAPVWAADSRSVLSVRSTPSGARQVWRVPRDGSAASNVGPGEGMAVSPDGHIIALLPERGSSAASTVGIVREGRAATSLAVATGSPIAIALSNDHVFVSTMSRSGESVILSMRLDGSDPRRLVGPAPDADKVVTFGRLILSPDAKSLAYTTNGDDGYSRLWVVPVAGGSPVQITSRRDGYPLGWTADSSAILFIEGNSFQGEQTALWRAYIHGLGRKMLVSGARL